MRDFALVARSVLDGLGVDYADARIIESVSQSVEVRTGDVESVESSDSTGFGVRVFDGGHMGFASSSRIDAGELERICLRAKDLARAAGAVRAQPLVLDELTPQEAVFEHPVGTDALSVPVSDKVDLLLRCDALLRKESAVKVTSCTLSAWRAHKFFVSSAGALIEQTLYGVGGGYTAFAVRNGETQSRSYPNSHGGNYASSGWEFIEALSLETEAPRVAAEAAALLTAPVIDEGEYDLIIGTSQLALQVHESIGHPLELDRVLGYEASYAGTSFATVDKLGSFKYGSPHLNVVADATYPGGLGTFGFDDEGVPAQRVPLIEGGVLVGYLSSRDTASVIGRRSSGASRASGWNRIPIVRMTNVNLLPGEWALDDLLADTPGGFFLDTNRSWSIDQRRVNFQFGTECAYRIESGRLGTLHRNPVYHGKTPVFWGSLDAVCSEKHYSLNCLTNCGKGEPGQSMTVGHGTSPARFRKVRLGGTPASA